MQKIPTGISATYWCEPDGEFKPASIPSLERGGPPGGEGAPYLCWLDQLFDGGVVLPEKDKTGRALLMLITGGPGTGKSTLATELCHRWYLGARKRSLYISTEAPHTWVKKHAEEFGWSRVDENFVTGGNLDKQTPISVVSFEDPTAAAEWLGRQRQPETLSLVDQLYTFFSVGQKDASQSIAKSTELPHVLVIDSLNTIPRQEQSELVKQYFQLAKSGPEIILAVLDSSSHRDSAEFWEFQSDVVIRLDRNQETGYLVRTIEIVKARFQSHVLGRHQLKIARSRSSDVEGDADPATRQLAHPYREEGGIFIFPSIHYVLSAYKRKSLNQTPEMIPTISEDLDIMLRGGFPEGRCVGFIGDRGGHKSHLGYMQLLRRLIEGPPAQKGLIVSLRDPAETAERTLERILKDRWPEKKLDDLLKQQLEIMYYPPGFITPEEFFHRLLLSVSRLKSSPAETHLTVLFNSLDQLASRFPLCAREQIFVTGIIQTLSSEGASSIFVAAEDRERPNEYYGLLSLAELILEFRRGQVPIKKYKSLVAGSLEEADRRVLDIGGGKKRDVIKLRVLRYAGGQAAGAGGFLELVEKGDTLEPLFGGPGLHFVPFVSEDVKSDD